MYGQDYEDALEMVQQSEFHNWWGDELIQKYIEKPLSVRQYKIMRNDLHEPLVFATWGFPNEEQVKTYMDSQEFPADAYKGGGKDAVCNLSPKIITNVAPAAVSDYRAAHRPFFTGNFMCAREIEPSN